MGKDGSKFDAVYTALYLDTGESMEFLETQIAETIADSHKPVERIFLYCDIVGTRFQVEKGMATEIALQAIQYIDEHYPTLGDYRVGVTDNDNKRPCLEFITTGKDITDSTHRFFVGVAAEADVQVPVIGDWRTDPDPRDKNTLDEIMTHNASLRIFWGGDETIEIRVSRDKIAEHMRKDGAFWMPADHNGAETFFRGMIFTRDRFRRTSDC